MKRRFWRAPPHGMYSNIQSPSDSNLVTQYMDKPFGNAQSQICSAHFTVESSLASEKVIENAVLQIVGNARTGVLNLEHHLVAMPASGQKDTAPFDEFDCIAYQVH
jgi:hypothetical protein